MNSPAFKVIVNTPSREIATYLQKSLLYQSVDLIYLERIEELPSYSDRSKPRLIIAYVPETSQEYRQTIEVIHKVGESQQVWFILLLSEGLPVEKVRASINIPRVFLQPYRAEDPLLLHNLLTLKEADSTFQSQHLKLQYKDNLNRCFSILYQEKDLGRALEQVVNYLPKVIDMDYWAIFTADRNMLYLEHFVQFVPPLNRRRAVLTHQLEKLASGWLKKGSSFLQRESENPTLFKKLSEWGWPVRQLYFMPIRAKGMAVGGITVASANARTLDPQEIRFLEEVNQLISRRILDQFTGDESSRQEIRDFADQLISGHFDEEAIFQHTCRKLNDIAQASSTVFWQYNKGFGFLFPKYYYIAEGQWAGSAPEKSVIFLNKERHLNHLIEQGKVQSLENISRNSNLDATTRQVFEQLGYNNVLIFPLKIHQEVIGAIIVNRQREQDRFNIWEIHAAEEIVKRAQMVLEDSYIVKEANLKLKQLSRIFELANELTLGLELREILSRITNNLRKSLGWNDIAILLEDEDGKHLRAETRTGFNKTGGLKYDFRKPIPVKEFTQFLDECEPIGNSYLFDSRLQEASHPIPETIVQAAVEWQENDLLIVPLVTRNKTLGYLVVHDPVDRLKPSEEKVMPLEYYANQIAVAVENVQLYEQLRISQERFRSLAETMSLALVTCDTRGKITYINPAFRRLLGYSSKQLAGRQLLKFFSGKDRESVQQLFERLLKMTNGKDAALENLEFEIVSKKGEPIPVSVLGYPFYERRKKTGFFLILNDLRMIKRLERMKADFNSMIVHDLRSPLNVIQGFIELIRNRVVGNINAEQEELLDIAKENVKKVLTLVDNFLVASRLDVGKFKIEPKLGDLNALIRRQVENHQVLMKNKNITITQKLDENLPLLLYDSLRIEQVLNNLLSNAMKFTPENGHIQVETRLIKEKVGSEEKFFARISVKDSGVGIPEDQIDHIFEKYEQVDAHQQFNIRGTGLGLSICKEIVKLHGGKISVKSKPGEGSEFFFTLPIESAMEKAIQ